MPLTLRALLLGPLGALPLVQRLRLRRVWGSLARVEPLTAWGTGRGRPVDRFYLDRWLAGHRLSGTVLEVKEDLYASRLGAERVEVVDIDADNARATIVADLCVPGSLPTGRFDAAVVTQTLQLVPDPLAAVRTLLDALVPGGLLLVTVPSLSRLIDADDRWRWTPAGLRSLLATAAPEGADVQVTGLGNGLAARAFLFGLATEDLPEQALVTEDPSYPLLAVGAVRLPA